MISASEKRGVIKHSKGIGRLKGSLISSVKSQNLRRGTYTTRPSLIALFSTGITGRPNESFTVVIFAAQRRQAMSMNNELLATWRPIQSLHTNVRACFPKNDGVFLTFCRIHKKDGLCKIWVSRSYNHEKRTLCKEEVSSHECFEGRHIYLLLYQPMLVPIFHLCLGTVLGWSPTHPDPVEEKLTMSEACGITDTSISLDIPIQSPAYEWTGVLKEFSIIKLTRRSQCR